jgi:hypothetical protein
LSQLNGPDDVEGMTGQIGMRGVPPSVQPNSGASMVILNRNDPSSLLAASPSARSKSVTSLGESSPLSSPAAVGAQGDARNESAKQAWGTSDGP